MIPALLIAAALALGVPALSFVSPTPNQVIAGSKVTVKIAVANFVLVDYKTHPKLVPGQGHLHLWLDQAKPSKTSAVKVISPTYTFANVKPGPHTLIAELAANDHSSLVPPITAAVKFSTSSSTTTHYSLPTPIVIAFLSLALALYFISTTKPKTGKPPRKSRTRTSKSRSRK